MMAKSSKAESRRRSRAITAIIKDIGRYEFSIKSTSEKNALIKAQISKTKKQSKRERCELYELNRKYKGTISA